MHQITLKQNPHEIGVARSIAGVIRAPGRTFEVLRKDPGRYFVPAAVMFVISAIPMNPLPGLELEDDPFIQMGLSSAASFTITALLWSLGYVVMLLVITRIGNMRAESPAKFRTVFVVLNYSQIPSLMALSVLWMANPTDEFTFMLTAVAIVVAMVVWSMVLAVKGIKSVYGYGSAKSFGVYVLGLIGMLVIVEIPYLVVWGLADSPNMPLSFV